MNAVLLLTWLGVATNILEPVVSTESVLDCPKIPCNCSLTDDQMTMDFLLMVDCSSRGLTKFPNFAFHESSKVRLVDLRNNSIFHVPVNAFPDVIIESIDFSFSDNITIHKNALQKIKNHLLKISLIDMDITFYEQLDYLKGLVQLRELVLDRNGGWPLRFPGEFFRGLKLLSLRNLSLKSCGIFRISWGAFVGLDCLQELDLSGNFLANIPPEISRLTKLRKLVLNSNQINSIPENTFQHLKDLRELHLVSNQLVSTTSIHEDSFRGLANSLNLLDFSNNGITEVPIHAIKYMDSLESLILRDNRIFHLVNGSFNGSFRLKTLDISGNPIHFEKHMFSGLDDSLDRLYLKNVKLPFLPIPALRNLRKLNYIDVSHNNFQNINGDFFRGLKARNIIMRSMKIRHVSPKAFLHLKRPIVMDIAGNKIHDVAFVVQAKRCTFYELNLSENPISCGCNVERIVSSGTVERLLGTCHMPRHHQGTNLQNHSLGVALRKLCGSSERIFCDWQAESRSGGAVSLGLLGCVISSIVSIKMTVS